MARILVVDDRPVDREVLTTLLGYGGHELFEAADGAEALEMVRRLRPDLVICDIQMPSMDGYEFARRLQGDPETAAIPLVFYTATYREREARDLARQCGVAHVLPKPTPPETILQTVQAILSLPPAMPVPAAAVPPHAGRHPRPLARQLAGYVDDVGAASQLIAAESAGRSRVQQLSAQLSETVAQLQAVSLRFAQLVETGLDLAAQRRPDELMDGFCRAAHDLCVARFAVAAVVEGGAFRHLTVRGIDLAALGSFSVLPAGILAETLVSGHSCRLQGAAASPAALGLPAGHPHLHSFLAVPVATANRVYGWLYLADKLGGHGFSETDERVALTLAGQTAIAYENLALVRRLEEHGAALEERVRERTAALALANEELQSFSYSVSHDLRAPLRSIDGFSALLLRGSADRLDESGKSYLDQVRAASQRMGSMIEALLRLATAASRPVQRQAVDLGALAREIAADLAAGDPARRVDWIIADGLIASCDPVLIRNVLENLLGNAWKYTAKGAAARIEFGAEADPGGPVRYFVRDNGAGFDPRQAGKLFTAFQRLHADSEFAGSGIGLASVRRIVHRHGGSISAAGEPGKGAVFKFTLEGSAAP